MEKRSKGQVRRNGYGPDIKMKKIVLVLFLLSVLISGLLGYAIGFKDGVNFAMNKAIDAANVLFDIQLTGKAKQLAIGFPDLINRIPLETRRKLGINNSEVYDNLNETISQLVRMKYGK